MGLPYSLLGPSAAARLDTWVHGHVDAIHDAVADAGAALIRGCTVADLATYAQVAQTVGGPLMEYVAGVDPSRRMLADRVYQAGGGPDHLDLRPHPELSHTEPFADRIMFYCSRPAPEGGDWLLVSGHALLEKLPREFGHAARERGIRHEREYTPRTGQRWQDIFGHDDPARLESEWSGPGKGIEWLGDGVRLWQDTAATIIHPCGEETWFNQSLSWYASPAYQEALVKWGGHRTWNHASFADGTQMDRGVMKEARLTLEQAATRIPVEPGDLLVVDNMRVLHGRTAFRGRRDVWTTLAGAWRRAPAANMKGPAIVVSDG